jgi:hypothetical protein
LLTEGGGEGGAIAKREADASEYIVAGVYLFNFERIHDKPVHTKLLNIFYSTLLRAPLTLSLTALGPI